jgi:hypothetical protein
MFRTPCQETMQQKGKLRKMQQKSSHVIPHRSKAKKIINPSIYHQQDDASNSDMRSHGTGSA